MSQLLGAMVDPPTPFGTLKEWESYLADLRKMGDFSLKELLVREAEQMIARKRCGGDALNRRERRSLTMLC
jgi:hypothetical protein